MGALAQLQVTADYDEAQAAKIPRTGPLVFIANHPFGLIDGMILCNLAMMTRGDFKILIYSLLCQVDLINPYLLPVAFEETREAMLTTINTKKQAITTLRQGGDVIIFLGGEVSTSAKIFGQATDAEWKLFAAKLTQLSQATVIPVYFHGQNSPIFHFVSRFSLTLRLSLLVHEFKNKMGQTIRLEIGDPTIPYQDLAGFKQRQQLLNHLREIIYSLPKKSVR